MGDIAQRVSWAVGILLLGWVLRTVNRIWWKPKKMESKIRAAGVDGTSYSLGLGDLKENLRLSRSAISKPITSTHAIASRVLPYHSQLARIYGKCTLSWFGASPRIIIGNPALIKEALFNKSGAIGKPDRKPPGKYISGGLLGLDGDKWAAHRKIIAPAFFFDKLKRMQPSFSLSCGELVRRWESLLSPDGICEVDVWPELQELARDVLSRAAFGRNNEQGRRIFRLQEELAQLVIRSFFYFQIIPGYRFLPTKLNRRMSQLDAEIDAILGGIIAEREKAMSQSHEDLLSLIMKANQEKSSMSVKDLVDECRLFYSAGQETTSVLLTWAMVALAMNPTWQDRAREEILQVFGGEMPDFERMSQLKIVTMILYEVLRLYPPVVFLTRRTKAAAAVGEYSLPAGVELVLSVLLAHHDADYWGEDAEEFNPERFAEGVARAPFFAFGGGHRVCVGQGFAMLEAKMVLASVLQRFSFELSPAYTHAPYTVFTLQPQHGAQLILRRL